MGWILLLVVVLDFPDEELLAWMFLEVLPCFLTLAGLRSTLPLAVFTVLTP